MSFELVIPESERKQTEALDAAATEIGLSPSHDIKGKAVPLQP